MTAPSFVNLSEAHLCTQCEAIGDSANRCPRCQSDALIAMTRVIPRHRDSIRLVCAGDMAAITSELSPSSMAELIDVGIAA
jgi:uncharacterized paraquat-inducible protein A